MVLGGTLMRLERCCRIGQHYMLEGQLQNIIGISNAKEKKKTLAESMCRTFTPCAFKLRVETLYHIVYHLTNRII